MSESQSRYSIVERLTRSKLDIMTSKSKLKEEVISKEQKVQDLKKDLDNWKQDYKTEKARLEREKTIQIEKAERDLVSTNKLLDNKEKDFNEKVGVLDKSLTSIEEISKTSPTINK